MEDKYDEYFVSEEIEPWSRFRPRALDPFGEWESSPDGKVFLIWKNPSSSNWKSRWAKRIAFKFNLKRDRQAFKLAYLFADLVGRVLKSSPSFEVKKKIEEQVIRTCPLCGKEGLIPPKTFGGKNFCTSCGYIPQEKNMGEKKLLQVYHKFFQLFMELEKLEPSCREEEELQEWEEVSPWVPLPLEPDEEDTASSSKSPADWALKKVKEARSLKDLAPLGKSLYKYSQSWSYETKTKIWAQYKARRKKLALYKSLASKKLIKPVLDARDKIFLSGDEKTQERIEEWVGKIPRLAQEEKEEVKNFLISFLPKGIREKTEARG